MTRENGHHPQSPDGYSHPMSDDPRYVMPPKPARPSPWMVWVGVILALLLVAGSAIWIIVSQGDESPSAQATPTVAVTPSAASDPSASASPSAASKSGSELLAEAKAPKGGNELGGITIGDPANPAVLRVFVDYRCGHCYNFEIANGQDIQDMVSAGTVQLDFHPMAFLAEDSVTAANAVVTVADAEPEKMMAFSMALFEASHADGFEAYTDQIFRDVASQVGVSADVAERFADGTFTDWVMAATQVDGELGITGTPTVLLGSSKMKATLEQPGSVKPEVEAYVASGAATAPTAP